MTITEFSNALAQLNINVTSEMLEQLEHYRRLIVEWNEKINLTGITDEKEMYLKHFYDSLTIFKIIDLYKEASLCDIGSGAGFPGIVLKIFFPHLKIVLLDSLNKRINFLNLVINELNLENIEALHIRAEDYSKVNRDKFSVVTARAVASLSILSELAIPMVKPEGYFIAMRGKSEEINKNIEKILNCTLENTIVFHLPVENSERTLLKYKKNKKTDLKFPRKFSEMKKSPL